MSQPKASASVTSQRVTLCGIKAIWAQMQKLSEHPAATGTMKVIRSKFPDRTREKVGELRAKGDKSCTVDDLLRALDTVIEQLELMEDTDPKDYRSSSALPVQDEPRSREYRRYSMKHNLYSSPTSFSPSKPTSRGPRSQQKVRCNFCLRHGQKAEDCRELSSPRERRKACIAFKLCWRCFTRDIGATYALSRDVANVMATITAFSATMTGASHVALKEIRPLVEAVVHTDVTLNLVIIGNPSPQMLHESDSSIFFRHSK